MKAEIEKVRRKFIALRSTLSERARRLWAGAEAESLGRGGIACVARATGMAISTVQKGRNEIRAGVDPAFVGDRSLAPAGTGSAADANVTNGSSSSSNRSKVA